MIINLYYVQLAIKMLVSNYIIILIIGFIIIY